MSCSDCTVKACAKRQTLPDDCTSGLASPQARDEALAFYHEPDTQTIVQVASVATGTAIKNKWSRLQETIFFAHEMGARRIGIASCIAFASEAKLLSDILRDEGFEVIDAICRIGSVTREEAGLCDADDERAQVTTCNPAMQAAVLNEQGTDLNLILGLCIGHDMLFTARSQAWTTTLAGKDQSRSHDDLIGDALAAYRE